MDCFIDTFIISDPGSGQVYVWVWRHRIILGLMFSFCLFCIWHLRRLILIWPRNYAIWKKVSLRVQHPLNNLSAESVCCVCHMRVEMKEWGSLTGSQTTGIQLTHSPVLPCTAWQRAVACLLSKTARGVGHVLPTVDALRSRVLS